MSSSETARAFADVPTVLERDCHVGRDGALKQREKIRQIAKVLREGGKASVSELAGALGLSRSTTWALLKADHKTSGLHAKLIGRMLAHKDLPPSVRSVLREYIIEKATGHYGHSSVRRRRFAAYFWDMPELADFLKVGEIHSKVARQDT